MLRRVRSPSRNRNLSTAGGLLAIGLWSTTFALARSLAEQVGPLTAATAVYLIGGAMYAGRLGAAGFTFRRSGQLSRKYLVGCGCLFAVYTVLVYLAVGLARDREELLEVALLNYLWPAGTILLSVWLLRLRFRWWLWPGTLLGLAGIFLVMTQGADVTWTSLAGHWRGNPAAYTLASGAALVWALYSALTRRWSTPAGKGGVGLFVPFTGLVLLGVRWFQPEVSKWTVQAGIEAVVLGAVTALAYGLWDAAMRKGDLVLVAAGSYFTPLLSTAVSCLYLGVVPGPQLWAGALLIVAGSMVSWRSVSDSKAPECEAVPA